MSKQTNSPTPEENSKMDALVKVVLVFFISLLSFSVGTFVGKQVSDSDHRRASLEGNATENHEMAAVHSEAKDEEVNDLASEFVQEQDNTGRAVASEEKAADEEGYSEYQRKDEVEPTAATPTTPEHKVMEAAEKVSKGVAPTSGKLVEAPRKPSSTLPAMAASTLGKYTVQVASFATEGEAKGQAAKLKTKGWNAFYVPAEIKGKTWYRVSIGMFEESQNAQAFMKKYLKESGAKDALVTKIVE